MCDDCCGRGHVCDWSHSNCLCDGHYVLLDVYILLRHDSHDAKIVGSIALSKDYHGDAHYLRHFHLDQRLVQLLFVCHDFQQGTRL